MWNIRKKKSAQKYSSFIRFYNQTMRNINDLSLTVRIWRRKTANENKMVRLFLTLSEDTLCILQKSTNGLTTLLHSFSLFWSFHGVVGKNAQITSTLQARYMNLYAYLLEYSQGLELKPVSN